MLIHHFEISYNKHYYFGNVFATVSKLDKGHSSPPSVANTSPTRSPPVHPQLGVFATRVPSACGRSCSHDNHSISTAWRSVSVVSLSLLLTTTLKAGEQGLWLPLSQKKTAQQGQLCEFPQAIWLSRGRNLVSAAWPITSCLWQVTQIHPFTQSLLLSLFKTRMRSIQKN